METRKLPLGRGGGLVLLTSSEVELMETSPGVGVAENQSLASDFLGS